MVIPKVLGIIRSTLSVKRNRTSKMCIWPQDISTVPRRLHPLLHYLLLSAVAKGYVFGTLLPAVAGAIDAPAGVGAIGATVGHGVHACLVVGVVLGGIGEMVVHAQRTEAMVLALFVY